MLEEQTTVMGRSLEEASTAPSLRRAPAESGQDTERNAKAVTTRSPEQAAMTAPQTSTCELAVGLLADIRGQPRTRKIERVHDEQGPGTGQTAGRHVGREESPEVGLGVVAGEHVLDRVLERKVEGLRGMVQA